MSVTMPKKNTVFAQLHSKTLNPEALVAGRVGNRGCVEAVPDDGAQAVPADTEIVAKRTKIVS